MTCAGAELARSLTAEQCACRPLLAPAPSWTDPAPTAGTTPIRAAHLTELRAAVVALE